MLTSDVARKAVSTNVLIIGFKNDRSSKDLLAWAVLLKVDAEATSKSFEGKKSSCEICRSVNDTSHFKRRDTGETFNIMKGRHECNSNHVIYLFECKQCQSKLTKEKRTVLDK